MCIQDDQLHTILAHTSLHSYNYGTLEIVTGPWREQKSDLGVLKEVAEYALRDSHFFLSVC